MNYFAFTGLVNGLVSTICGAIVFGQNPTSKKNQIYGLYCLSLSVWSYFYFFWRLATDHGSALFYSRALMVGAIFIPTLHYHHIMALFDMDTPARGRWLAFSYGLGFFFLIFNFSPYFVADVGQKMMLRYWQIPGPLYHPFLAMFLLQVVLSNRLLWLRWKTASTIVQNKVLWIALATTIGYTSGCTNFCLQYDIPVPPFLNIAVSFYVVTAALLFFQFELVDVRYVLKHISVVLLIYGSLLAIVLPAAVPVANYALRNSTSNLTTVLLSFGLVVGGALSIGPFIYAYLVRDKTWLRGHLTAGLAHELKTPIGIIQGALDVTLKNIERNGPKEKTLEYLQMIQANTEKLGIHVYDLLEVAKKQDGELRVQKSLFSLKTLIIKVIEDHMPFAQEKELDIKYGPNGIDEINGDQEKIRKVFSNLLSNAIKFSKSGAINIRTEKAPNGVQCIIEDQGQGIPKRDLDKVFERFFQGKHSNKGSGIGLTIAKAWVEAHGGKIWAESEGEGKGTRVTFTLPT